MRRLALIALLGALIAPAQAPWTLGFAATVPLAGGSSTSRRRKVWCALTRVTTRRR